MINYLKQLLFSLKEIIITYILQYLLIIILCLISILLGNNNINNFINSPYCIIPTLLFYIITIIYLYKKNKIFYNKLPKNLYYPLITLGISISCLLNMIIFKINIPTITNKVNPILLLISSSLIGPIYEEILFRYILQNRLKKFNSNHKSIIISTIIFSLIHITPIKIFYAFILGLILNITYHKTNNLTSSIIIHIYANSISLLLNQYNTNILILSIILLLVTYEYLKEIKP
jgi:hypothetical protein